MSWFPSRFLMKHLTTKDKYGVISVTHVSVGGQQHVMN